MSNYFMYGMALSLIFMMWLLVFSAILQSTFFLIAGVLGGVTAVTCGIIGLIVQDIWS